jgi:putative nucleotidyltransferase with HDIG domain
VKVRPDLSDPRAFDTPAMSTPEPSAPPEPGPATGHDPAPEGLHLVARVASAESPADAAVAELTAATAALDPAQARRAQLAAQRDSLIRSERLHAQATRAWQGITRDAVAQPTLARDTAASLAGSMVTQLCEDDNTTVRMLSEAAGTASSQHAINVCVLSLMLARRLGLDEAQLQGVAMGALLHDIGKLLLPDHLRNLGADCGALAEREQREHVAQGLRLGMSMGLDALALRVIAQHHELRDGSGLPKGLSGDDIVLPARIVGLVNFYDRLCNPRQKGSPLRTPHEAQALMFAQMRHKLDVEVLGTFVKLLGVYPPGSVVQLSDERIAMVVGVHPMHPLRPSVLVYDPKVAPADALLLHLVHEGSLSVRRSLHPQHLPRAMLDYLSPRDRVNYYFAHGLEPAAHYLAA